MRKVFCLLLLFCALFNSGCAMTGGSAFDSGGEGSALSADTSKWKKQGKVFINGTQLEEVSYVHTFPDGGGGHVAIPVLAVVRALGAQVTEIDVGIYQIQHGDERYILDMSEKTLRKNGEDENLIVAAPGSRGGCAEQMRNDFFVSDNLLKLFFSKIGVRMERSLETGDVRINSMKK